MKKRKSRTKSITLCEKTRKQFRGKEPDSHKTNVRQMMDAAAKRGRDKRRNDANDS